MASRAFCASPHTHQIGFMIDQLRQPRAGQLDDHPPKIRAIFLFLSVFSSRGVGIRTNDGGAARGFTLYG